MASTQHNYLEDVKKLISDAKSDEQKEQQSRIAVRALRALCADKSLTFRKLNDALALSPLKEVVLDFKVSEYYGKKGSGGKKPSAKESEEKRPTLRGDQKLKTEQRIVDFVNDLKGRHQASVIYTKVPHEIKEYFPSDKKLGQYLNTLFGKKRIGGEGKLGKRVYFAKPSKGR